MEGDVNDDAGACLSDGVEALHTQGLCPETMWPYSDDKVGTICLLWSNVQPVYPIMDVDSTLSPRPVIPLNLSESVQGAATSTLLPVGQIQRGDRLPPSRTVRKRDQGLPGIRVSE